MKPSTTVGPRTGSFNTERVELSQSMEFWFYKLCGKGEQVNVTAQFSRRRLENIPEELAVKFAWSNSCDNIAFKKKTWRCHFDSYWILWLAAAWAASYFGDLCLQKQLVFFCRKLELDAGDLGSNSTCDLGHTSSPLKFIFSHEKQRYWYFFHLSYLAWLWALDFRVSQYTTLFCVAIFTAGCCTPITPRIIIVVIRDCS